MVREIKFRAWDKKKKEMLINYDLPGMNGSFVNLNEVIEMCQKEPYVLMQYTGLKDKNGKDIYEGDIVKQTYEDGFEIGKVTFSNGQFWSELIPPYNWDPMCPATHIEEEITEILGNIYENPELLESV